MIEKSKDMSKRYEGGIDTWGNRERQLYQKIFKRAVELAFNHHDNTSTDLKVTWYDVGAGGGNIWDTILENTGDHAVKLRGCDISDVAVNDLNDRYSSLGALATRIDLEEYDHTDLTTKEFQDFYNTIHSADVVSIVDVAYYFGEKRPWKDTMKEIWDSIKPNTIVVVADSLIPYQRRSYFNTLDDCELLDDYTDYTEKVSEEHRDNGKVWHRYLKVKIYWKVAKDV